MLHTTAADDTEGSLISGPDRFAGLKAAADRSGTCPAGQHLTRGRVLIGSPAGLLSEN